MHDYETIYVGYSSKGEEWAMPGSFNSHWEGSTLVTTIIIDCNGNEPSNCNPGVKRV